MPPAAEVWRVFRALSRGRTVALAGTYAALTWRDIRDASREVRTDLPREVLAAIMTALDDEFLELVSNGNLSRGNQ